MPPTVCAGVAQRLRSEARPVENPHRTLMLEAAEHLDAYKRVVDNCKKALIFAGYDAIEVDGMVEQLLTENAQLRAAHPVTLADLSGDPDHRDIPIAAWAKSLLPRVLIKSVKRYRYLLERGVIGDA